MKITELKKDTILKWKGTLIKTKGVPSSYKLIVSADDKGEIGALIVSISNNTWKVFYYYVDKDCNNINLKNRMYKKIENVCNKAGAKLDENN